MDDSSHLIGKKHEDAEGDKKPLMTEDKKERKVTTKEEADALL